MRRIVPILVVTTIVGIGFFVRDMKKKSTSTLSPFSEKPPTRQETTAPEQPFLLFPIPTSSTIIFGFSTSSPHTVVGWTTGTVDIAINGGYFNEDYTPSGYIIANGSRIGSRQFDEDKSGLLAITSNTIRIHDLATTPLASIPLSDIAIQSYPFLIKNGIAAVKEDSGKRARRTAVGIDTNGRAHIIISRSAISLHTLSQALSTSSIRFETVLNLDGGPSTGIVYHTATSTFVFDSITPVPQAILIDVLNW